MKYKACLSGLVEAPNMRVFDTERGESLTAVQIAEALNQLEELQKQLASVKREKVELEEAAHSIFNLFVEESQANPYQRLSGVAQIARERGRQIKQKGWTAEHDDKWVGGELLKAANSYIWAFLSLVLAKRTWPWDAEWFKPTSHLRNLAKAGALIAAEIDRLQRKDEGD